MIKKELAVYKEVVNNQGCIKLNVKLERQDFLYKFLYIALSTNCDKQTSHFVFQKLI